jgi:dihydrolipoamide dehydrogenase
MARTEVKVPDIGGYDDVPVIELLVAVGDTVKVDQGLVTLESDKATMEVPSSVAGKIVELKVKVGDKLSEGSVVAIVEAEGAAEAKPADAAPKAAAAAPAAPAKGRRTRTCTCSRTRRIACAAGDGIAVRTRRRARAGPPPPRRAARPTSNARSSSSAPVPGGYNAAFRAADLDMDTVIVERYATLGGVCLNVGCIPSKALLHAAAVVDEAAHAKDFGITFDAPKIDLDKLRSYKDKVVGQLTKGLAGMGKQRKVRTVQGTAKFVSPNELEITSEGAPPQLLKFKHCIIAAGSQPVKLPSFDWKDKRIMDSTDALELAEIPKTLLVVGGGIIGLEMATVFRALGSEVTVVELLDQLMPAPTSTSSSRSPRA